MGTKGYWKGDKGLIHIPVAKGKVLIHGGEGDHAIGVYIRLEEAAYMAEAGTLIVYKNKECYEDGNSIGIMTPPILLSFLSSAHKYRIYSKFRSMGFLLFPGDGWFDYSVYRSSSKFKKSSPGPPEAALKVTQMTENPVQTFLDYLFTIQPTSPQRLILSACPSEAYSIVLYRIQKFPTIPAQKKCIESSPTPLNDVEEVESILESICI